jgi:PIN domain nuclease of toxin-antitoxin system
MSSLAANRLEPYYVVDTHALIWYLTGNRNLSATARNIFLAAESGETQLVISAIAVAEMYYAHQKTPLFKDFIQMYQRLRSSNAYQFADFLPDDVLDFDNDAAVPEMHDRIIAGLARRLGAPLITLDPLIVSANVVPTVW